MQTLRVDGLSRTFISPAGPPIPAVKSLSFQAHANEFLVLCGPSGCGKTTTLRLIAGLETPDAGSIVLDGVDLTAQPPHKRDFALLFQQPALYPHLTVRQNLELTLKLRRQTSAAHRLEQVLESTGIAPFLDQLPQSLSGGQSQRAALARALIRDPRVILLDEPLSQIDPENRAQLRRTLKKVLPENGSITLYVTHDHAEAMALADRILVMHLGSVMQIGTPEQIHRQPNHLLVARFFGEPTINTIPCKIKGQHLHPASTPLSSPLLLPQAIVARIKDGAEIVLGIRPRSCRVTRHFSESDPDTFHIRFPVEFSELDGPHYWVGRYDQGHSLQGLSEHPIAPGTEASLWAGWKDVHFFDSASGSAIAYS